MTTERYNYLMWDHFGEPEATLTEQEIKAGWHFCPDWDFLLIGPGDPEMDCCGCGIEV